MKGQSHNECVYITFDAGASVGWIERWLCQAPACTSSEENLRIICTIVSSLERQDGRERKAEQDVKVGVRMHNVEMVYYVLLERH